MKNLTFLIVFTLFHLCMTAQTISGQTGVITSAQSDAEGTVAPRTIEMATFVGVTVTRTITITNTGTVTFTPLTAFNSDYGFIWIDTDALGQEVHPLPDNNILKVNVTYTPTMTGTHHAHLNVRIGDVIHYVDMYGTALMRGDANKDGNISISDINTIIDALLANSEYDLALDCNMDGAVTIQDLSILIDFLLGGPWPDPQPEPEMQPGIVTVNGVSFKMMPVEGGTFTMGATPEQGNDFYSNECPTHQVTLPSYYMSETEVTQALWRAVMGSNPSYFSGDLMRPIEQVSWNSCQQFITKLNQMTGYNFRLPTEAEWEYAARGGNKSNGTKYAGSNSPDGVCWYSHNSSNATHPVAKLAPNELGLYDMSGNVFEWCQDWYGEYNSDSQVNPTGPADGTAKVCRGGAWAYDPAYERITYRYNYAPASRGADIGFRLAIDSTFTPPTQPPFTLSCLEVNMTVEDVVKVGINNGSGNYTVSCTNAGIVSCDIEGDSIVLTGLAEGATKVTLTDTDTEAQISFPVTVNPKDNSETFIVNGVSFKMVPVEGGSFMMGATPEQIEQYYTLADEYPVHKEFLSDYLIGQTEVTQALWLAVMGSNPSEFSSKLMRPVERVSWLDCQEFISRLNALTGKEFRLPTEAEWEYAARGGVRSEGYKYAGSDNVSQVGWYFMNAYVMGESSPNYGPHEVAKLKANELGLYDMSGNVAEWCQDLYATYTADPFSTGTPSNDSTRVYRGGSWAEHDNKLRISSRDYRVPTVAYTMLGLRLAMSVPLDPTRLSLSQDSLNMDVGSTQRVKIINGSGQYTLDYDTTLATCQITVDGILSVTSRVAGEHVITITDEVSHGQVTLNILAIEAQTIIVNGVSIRMIKVEGGSFMMGAQNGIGSASEIPSHKVNVSTFYVSEVEVPQKLWRAVYGYNPQNYTGDENPYLVVSATDQAFIKKLNQKTGLNFRLPTEAEWEYAARGGNKSQGYLYAGSNNLDEVAWTIENSDGTPQPVGTKKPNELYIYDMSGNALEWCLDTYNDYDLIEQTNPLFVGTSITHIYRGGCVTDTIGCCRTTWRSSAHPASYKLGGVRLVLGDAIDMNALALSCVKKSIAVGGETSVAITNGSGSYDLNYDSGIISCQVVDDNLVVTGTSLGTTTVVVTDQQTQQQCSLEVNVIVANTYTVNGITFTMIPVEGGTFTMGATEEQEYYAASNESPAHQVTLSDYAIGQTEVTSALWNAVMNGTTTTSTYPKSSVNLEDVKAFIGRLNAITGAKFRLPTEAEWEYAARGGNKSQGYLYSGSNYIDKVAWFKYNSDNHNHPVALKEPNELGLYDMSGNVREMCMDYSIPYTAEAQTNPCNLIESFFLNSRGGIYGWEAKFLRVSARQDMIPSSTASYQGFRLAMGNAQPSPELTAIPRHLNINVGQQDSITIKYGSGNYILSKDKDIVTWEQDSNKVVFTATGPGDVTVTIEDIMSHDQTSVEITNTQTTTYTVNGVSFDLVDVEGGTFTMGIPSTAYNNDYGHEVTLSDYSIGQTEVTVELWQAVMGGNQTTNLQVPKAGLSWYKCQEFIMKLNALTGENFRLPTEAEWEFAAMGGNMSHGYTYAGSENIDEVAWYKSNSSRLMPVAQKKPNELMLYDMSGNAQEICRDIYGYYPQTPQVNPTGAAVGTSVPARGGDYVNTEYSSRVKRRFGMERTATYSTNGLRLAKGDAVTPPTIELIQSDIAMNVGEQATAKIAYSTGYCHVEYDPNIVTCQLSGQNIIVTANKVGAANVIVYDDLAHCQTTLYVLVKDTETVTVNGVSFEMVNLPGGTFTMGATDEQAYTINITSYPDEKPAHQVTLSPFSIGQTEVTQELWLAVMGSNPSSFNDDLQRPVETISWDDCLQFITQLNALTGKHFRLPTEAEWEYAARGGNSQRYVFSGANSVGDVGWYKSNSSSMTHPVAQKRANAIGLYDMTGNVGERCSDWKGTYSAEPQTNPTGPATGNYRIVRGSNWTTSSQSSLKNAYRGSAPEGAYDFVGLRLVMVAD